MDHGFEAGVGFVVACCDPSELFDLGERNNTAFSVPFGDLEGFIARIRNIDLLLESSPASSVKDSLLTSSRQLIAKYSPQAMASSLRVAIEKLII